MKPFKVQIADLSTACFDIEKQLPMFGFSNNGNEMELRRSLYRIRCDLNSLTRYAEITDDGRNNYDTH